MKTTERISRAQGIANLQAAPDKDKLKVYKLTLEEIFRALGQDLQVLTAMYLEDLKEGLHETINGFYDLMTRPREIKRDIKKTIPILMQANAYLLSAATALQERKGKGFRYFGDLQKCRMKIFEALELLS